MKMISGFAVRPAKLARVRILALLAVLVLVCCSPVQPSRWGYVEETRQGGTYYGTFQSYQPSFAVAGGRLYKTFMIDGTEADNSRTAPMTLFIQRLEGRRWRTVWSETGPDFDPACLVADGNILYAAIAQWQSRRYRLLEINGNTIITHESADPWDNAAKQNCVIFQRQFLMADTYGRILPFRLRDKSFGSVLQAFDQHYQPDFATQYPQFSVVGNHLFVGNNTAWADGRWRYRDVIARVVTRVTDLSEVTSFASLFPDDLKEANTFVADTAANDNTIFIAASVNDYPTPADYFTDHATGLSNNRAFFAICSRALRCTIQRTNIPQDLSGNFVWVGSTLFFFGGGQPAINVWRWSGQAFVLIQRIPTNLRCAYAFNFSPAIDGAIEGQVMDTRRCNSGAVDDTYVAFRLAPAR